MSSRPAGLVALVAHRVIRPPLREARFWIVEAGVAVFAAVHLTADIVSADPGMTIPAGLPVILLLAPVTYAALQYGLSGSVFTAVLAAVLWLPDLLLPGDRGHPGNDLIELAFVIALAVFVGYHIDAEHLAVASAQRARSERRAVEARYRQLFDANAAPILVADRAGRIVAGNPAADMLTGKPVAGRSVRDVLGFDLAEPGGLAGRISTIPAPGAGPRDYRLIAAEVPTAEDGRLLTQLVLEDITEERAEGDRAHRFAGLLLRVQEEERRRIAQEIHDEPLQLLVHLARSLEQLDDAPQTQVTLADGLGRARRQTLDVAARLRAVVAGLRPPALEQLGLAAALRGIIIAETGVGAALRADLSVTGTESRLAPEVEVAVFRIAQEAVHNVIRHAAASQLSVTLEFGGGGLGLRVADDGCGFDPGALHGQPLADRLGMLGMQERALFAGGSLMIRSSPGQGTVVDIAFPAQV